jgi:AcrR family transcriptional regulator
MGSYDWIGRDLLEELHAKGLLTSTFLRLDEARRGAVLEAIFAESARRGPELVAIKEVAAAAGVPVGSLYQYFRDRRNLIRCAVVLNARKMTTDLEAWAPALAAMPFREALAAYLLSGLEWSREESISLRAFVAAVYGSATRGSPFGSAGAEGGIEEDEGWLRRELVKPVAAAIQSMLRAVVQAASERGELRAGIDVEATARLVNALLIALGDASLMPGLEEYYRLFDETRPPEAMMVAAIELVWSGVGAP